MKQVQIYGTDGNRYRTSDGLKTAIGNAQHNINSFAWCDGEFLLGGQQYSSYVPYVPIASGGIILACPIIKPGGRDPYNPYDGNQDTYTCGYEIFNKNKCNEYPSDKFMIKTHYSPFQFITDGNERHFMVMTNNMTNNLSPNYSIIDLNANEKVYDKIGDFDDGVIDQNDLYWFHVDRGENSVATLQLLKNGSSIKTFTNDITSGNLASSAMSEFTKGLVVDAGTTISVDQDLRDYFLKDQVPDAWIKAGLKPGRICYGLEDAQYWDDELNMYECIETAYSLPPGPCWKRIARYWTHCQLTTPDGERPIFDVKIDVGAVHKLEGQTTGKFGADKDEYLVSKRCISGLGISYTLKHGDAILKEIDNDNRDAVFIPFWISDLRYAICDKNGETVEDETQVMSYEIDNNGTTTFNVIDMSAYTNEPSFALCSINANKHMTLGTYMPFSSNGYYFNDYGYKIQNNTIYYKDLLIGNIPLGYDPLNLAYHDSDNLYFLDRGTIETVNMATGNSVQRNLPQIPVMGRWFKNKNATKVVRGLISDV